MACSLLLGAFSLNFFDHCRDLFLIPSCYAKFTFTYLWSLSFHMYHLSTISERTSNTLVLLLSHANQRPLLCCLTFQTRRLLGETECILLIEMHYYQLATVCHQVIEYELPSVFLLFLCHAQLDQLSPFSYVSSCLKKNRALPFSRSE